MARRGWRGRAAVAALAVSGGLLLALGLQSEREPEPSGWIRLDDAAADRAALAAGTGADGKIAKEDEGDGTADADRVDGAGGGRSEEDRAGSGQAEAQPAGGYAADGRLDLNRATAEELDGLPGVGPAKAKAIVEDRERNGPFASVDEVERVKGIGPKLLEKWKNLVVVSQEM